jgi:RNA polymerase sigma factor (sigma-70 family)
VARIVREPATAEDVTQATFVQVWEQRETLRSPEAVKRWIYQIAHHFALRQVTRGPATVAMEEELQLASVEAGPEEKAVSADAARLVWDAAASLEPHQLAILDLSVRCGLASSEIAEILEVDTARASLQVNRAKEALGNAVRYLLVARRRSHCERLAELVPAGVGQLTPEQRATVDHHMRRCPTCQGMALRLTAPEELFGALLLLPLPGKLTAPPHAVLTAAHVARLSMARPLAGKPPHPVTGHRLIKLLRPASKLRMAIAAVVAVGLVGGAIFGVTRIVAGRNIPDSGSGQAAVHTYYPAGTVIVAMDPAHIDQSGGSAAVIAPTDTTSASETIATTQANLTAVAVAPYGTPNAGTFYIGGWGDVIETVAPDGSHGQTTIPCTEVGGLAVAPAGTPNAGTVYASCNDRGVYDLAIVPPGGGSRVIQVGTNSEGVAGLAVAPAGVPNAGNVYIADNNTTGGSNALTVVSPDGTVSGHIALGGWTFDVAVAPAGSPNAGTVYASSNKSTADGEGVYVISPQGKVETPLHGGADPTGIAVGADGTIYVVNNAQPGTLAILTPSGQRNVVTVGDYPQWVTVASAGTPNAGTIYVSNTALNGKGSVSVLAPNTTTVASTIVLPNSATPEGLAVMPQLEPNAATAAPSSSTASTPETAGPSTGGDSGYLAGLKASSLTQSMWSELPTGGQKDASNSDSTSTSYLWQNLGVISIGTGPDDTVTGVSCEDDTSESEDADTAIGNQFLDFCINLAYTGAAPAQVRSWVQDEIDSGLNGDSADTTTIRGQVWQITFASVGAVYLDVGYDLTDTGS